MKNIILSVGVMALVLVATAGCNKNADSNPPNAPAPDLTNSVPSTNMPPVTNTDLLNTNLSTNHTAP
jgi:hypothetical protein